MDDTKALAAKARSQTGGPVLVPNAAELSGVRPRRDSVIGARLTPPPRATGAEMPNWIWGLLGCLTVLLVGSVGLFVLLRSGKLNGLIGDSAPVVAAVPPPAPVAEPAPAEPAPAPAEPAAPAAAEPPSRPARAPVARAAAEEPAPAPAGDPEPAAAPAAAPSDEPKRAARPSAKAAGKPTDEAPAAAPPAGEPEAEPAAAPAEPKATARPARAAVAAKPAAEKPAVERPAEDEADDDQTPPGQDAVEAALDALATRVRGCFVKYQIKGTARVRLVATPGGTPESVSVTGDFEDTPTGLCVESVVASAKLPSFKGAPLKLSQSYQLR